MGCQIPGENVLLMPAEKRKENVDVKEKHLEKQNSLLEGKCYR